METYRKPVIIMQSETREIIPIAAFVAGLSAADIVAAAAFSAATLATLAGDDDVLPRRSAMNRLDTVYSS